MEAQGPQGSAPVAWEEPRPAAEVPGAKGFVYADLPNRIIALIVDSIVVGIIAGVVGIILGIAGLKAGLLTSSGTFDAVASIVSAVVVYSIAFAYFWYSWTVSRATLGMRLLGMQVGNAYDGKTLTTDQALRRALALWGPGLLSYFFTGLPAIGFLISIISLGWVVYLLYTTYSSPTKQGFHDKFANSVVVKAVRVA